jgi:hypothetical protein
MLFGVILGKYGGKILASVAVVSLQNLFGTETSNRKPRERRGKKDEPSCLSTRRKEPREWTTTTMVQKSCYRTMQSTTMAISESLTNLLALIEVSTNLLVLIEVLVVKSHTNTMLSTAMAESRSWNNILVLIEVLVETHMTAKVIPRVTGGVLILQQLPPAAINNATSHAAINSTSPNLSEMIKRQVLPAALHMFLKQHKEKAPRH